MAEQGFNFVMKQVVALQQALNELSFDRPPRAELDSAAPEPPPAPPQVAAKPGAKK